MARDPQMENNLLQQLRDLLDGKPADPSPTPTPPPTPAPAPQQSAGLANWRAASGAMSAPDLTTVADTVVVPDDYFTPENPGSYDTVWSGNPRSFLENLYTGIDEDQALSLLQLAANREVEADNVAIACDAYRDLAKTDSQIILEKLRTRDAVADEQLKVSQAVGDSLKKQGKRAEAYSALTGDVFSSLAGSAKQVRKTAAEYGLDFNRSIWGGR